MKLFDPTSTPAEAQSVRAPKLDTLDGKVVGLLSNGKVNADLLLSQTAEIFRREHDCRVLKMVYKTNASAPAPEQVLDRLRGECDFLLTASGD